MAKSPGNKAQEQDVEEILNDLKSMVLMGLKPKSLATGVEDELRKAMRPKIKARLEAGGDWEHERANPLICALHLGEIARILSRGNTVSKSVAKTALDAIKNDEHCLPTGVGLGDWCA